MGAIKNKPHLPGLWRPLWTQEACWELRWWHRERHEDAHHPSTRWSITFPVLTLAGLKSYWVCTSVFALSLSTACRHSLCSESPPHFTGSAPETIKFSSVSSASTLSNPCSQPPGEISTLKYETAWVWILSYFISVGPVYSDMHAATLWLKPMNGVIFPSSEDCHSD